MGAPDIRTRPIELQQPATSYAPDERSPTLDPSGVSWPPQSPRESIPMSSRQGSFPSRPLSATTYNSTRKLKYGHGKFAAIELVPQPSDDPADPLNWRRWRKELNFVALLFMVGIVNSTKTVFISVNAEIPAANRLNAIGIAMLTAIPLMLSALTNLSSSVAARAYGKRPVYLVSALLMLIGCTWASGIKYSYDNGLAARVFQGLGWGAFDALVLGSIQDTFFEHQRQGRIAFYHIIVVGTTWGPPLSGALTPNRLYTAQFVVISVLCGIALPLLVFGAPETSFTRRTDNLLDWQPRSQTSMRSDQPQPGSIGDSFGNKMKKFWLLVHPAPYRGQSGRRSLLQTIRSAVAPTVLLVVAVSFLPLGLLWTLSQTLASVYPGHRESPGVLGLTMAGPFVLGTIATARLSYWRKFRDRFTKKTNLVATGVGTGLATASAIVYAQLISGVIFDYDSPRLERGNQFGFLVLSILLGLLAVGSVTLVATGWPLVAQSAQYTASSLPECAQRTADMSAGVTAWLALLAGATVMAAPGVMQLDASHGNGVWNTAVGLGVTQFVISVGAVVVWSVCGDRIRRWDGSVIGRADLDERRRTESFFDHDY